MKDVFFSKRFARNKPEIPAPIIAIFLNFFFYGTINFDEVFQATSQFTEKKIEELERMMVFLERSKSVILQKLNNNEY